MASTNKALSVTLVLVGAIFIVGLFPLTLLWPDGFMWEPRQPEYEQMILITFAVLGVFLLKASANPAEHHSLISFAAWSSLIHGLLMLVQAIRDPAEQANLFGDVPAVLLIGIVLLVLNRPSPASGAAETSTSDSTATPTSDSMATPTSDSMATPPSDSTADPDLE